MKKSDIEKLNKKTIADLQKDLTSSKDELRGLRFDLATGKVKNIAKIRNIRKRIARIMTFMHSKNTAITEKEDGKDK